MDEQKAKVSRNIICADNMLTEYMEDNKCYFILWKQKLLQSFCPNRAEEAIAAFKGTNLYESICTADKPTPNPII